jgi:hypothetical protein
MNVKAKRRRQTDQFFYLAVQRGGQHARDTDAAIVLPVPDCAMKLTRLRHRRRTELSSQTVSPC